MALLTSPSDGHSAEQAYDRRWWTLAVLCLSLLIVFVGNSSLNVAIPTLSRDLGATESQLQWVVAVYSLVFAGLLFSTGALGDRFGRKGALQLGLALFLVGAALASQATDDVAAHRVPRGDGRRRRVHHAVDAVDPRQRLPRPTSGPRRSRSGPAITGVAGRDRPGRERLPARPLLVRLGLPRQRADHRRRARRRQVPRPEVDAIPKRRARPARRGAVDRRRSSTLVYGLIEAPDKGWVSAGDARRVRDRGRRARAVRARGSCTPTSRCSTCTTSATRRSAPGPAA